MGLLSTLFGGDQAAPATPTTTGQTPGLLGGAPMTLEDRFSNPLSQIGLAMMAGAGTPGRGFGPSIAAGLANSAKIQKEKQQRNATLEMIQKDAPDLAGYIQAGVPVTTVFSAWADRKTAEKKAALGLDLTTDQRNFKLAQSDPAFAKFIQHGRTGAAGGPRLQSIYDEATGREQRGYFGDDGQFVPVGGQKVASGGTGDGNLKLTEGQSKDLNYYQRGNAALPTIEKNEAELSSASNRALGAVPIVGNYMTSNGYQLGDQAGREFLASILRKDSGAAITQGEMDVYGPMFLPQPGDGEDVIAQKRAARTRALEAMKSGLGTATPLSEAPVTQNPGIGAQPDVSGGQDYRGRYGLE